MLLQRTNGRVPLQATHAFVALAKVHGLKTELNSAFVLVSLLQRANMASASVGESWLLMRGTKIRRARAKEMPAGWRMRCGAIEMGQV